MTVYSGDGFKDFPGALAALSRGSAVVQQDENFITYRQSFGGGDYVVTIGARNIDPDAEPGGGDFGFDKVIGSIHITNIAGDKLAVMGPIPRMTLGDFLDLGGANAVEKKLFSRDDTFGGRDNPDRFEGLGGDDEIRGAGGADQLSGGDGADHLEGEAGSDRLKGGSGADTLLGGAGADTTAGGGGEDLFFFERARDSGPAEADRDVIEGFDRGADLISFALLQGDGPAFEFIGKGRFDGENQVRYETDGKGAIVFVNLDGDNRAEFSIRIEDVGRLSADDFII